MLRLKMSHIKTMIAAVTFLASGPASAQISTGFCASYTQISSNAGTCANCTIQVAPIAAQQSYVITSNNGWTATANWVDGDFSVVTGQGVWGPSSGSFAGQGFTFDMNAQGEQVSMTLGHFNAQFGVVQAVLQCN